MKPSIGVTVIAQPIEQQNQTARSVGSPSARVAVYLQIGNIFQVIQNIDSALRENLIKLLQEYRSQYKGKSDTSMTGHRRRLDQGADDRLGEKSTSFSDGHKSLLPINHFSSS